MSRRKAFFHENHSDDHNEGYLRYDTARRLTEAPEFDTPDSRQCQEYEAEQRKKKLRQMEKAGFKRLWAL